MFDMKKQLMWSKLRVGLVITAALSIIFITVLFAGSIENLFETNITIYAHIKDVRGLRSGSPVWLHGLEIGSVKDIRLNPKNGTIVTLSIHKKASEFVAKDSTATVMTMGLLGDKYIEINSGTHQSGMIMPEDVIQGRVQLEMGDLVQTTAGSIEKVTQVIEQMGHIIKKVDDSKGTVGLLLNDPTLYNNLKESTRSLAVTLKEIETSNGSLKKLVKDPSLYDNLDKTSKKLAAVMEGLEAGKGTAGKLLKDEEMARQLKESVTGLNQLVNELKDMVKDIKENPKRYFKFSVF